MPQNDPIGDFIALPRDQQIATLQALPRGTQDQLLLAVKVRRSRQPYKGPAPMEGSAFQRFTSSAVAPIKGAVRSLVDASPTPQEKAEGLTSSYDYLLRPIERVVQAQAGQVGEAENLAKQGRYSEAAGHALASVVPLLGPWVADATQQFYDQLGKGDVAGAVGTAAGNTALAFTPKVIEKAKGLAPRAVESFRSSMKRAGGASPADIPDAAQSAVDANRRAAEAHQSKAQEAVEVQREARAKAIEKNRTEAAAHKAATDEAKAHNQRILDERKARSEATRKLDESSQELRARIETAREKALKVGNQKYSTVNEKLNPIGADMETIMGGVGDAMDKIKGSDTEPAILKDIDKKIGEGEALTYKDLQGYYSELNRELSKGTLAGDVFAAYDTLHDAIGKEMQRIADSQGAGQQLVEARNYWRRMKQTFGKPFTPGDVATQTLKGVTPDFVKNEEMANRLRLLGSFDPRIPQLAENVENLQQGLHSLGKEKPLREEVKQNPAPITPAPVPKMENAAVPDRPQDQTLTPQQIQELQREKIIDTGNAMRNSKTASVVGHALTGFGSTWALVEAFRGDLRYAGEVLAARISIGLMQQGVGRMLSDPAFAEWLSKPTAKDIEALKRLTPEQKEVFGKSLQQVIQQAPARGIKISPRLRNLVTGITLTGASGKKNAPAPRAQNPTDAWQGIER